MTTEGKLQQAEADLESLIIRVVNVLPTLRRGVDDSKDGWQKEIRAELLANLEETLGNAQAHQSQRRGLGSVF